MKLSKFIWSVGVLCGWTVCCVSMQIDVEKLSMKDVSGVVEATERATTKVGEEISIKLKSNSTTGYQWRLGLQQFDAVLSVEKKEYSPSVHNKKLVGAGGFDIWTFKALKAGTANLLFENLRSWEPGSTRQRVNIKVDVIDDIQ